jgi:hypothetical protein
MASRPITPTSTAQDLDKAWHLPVIRWSSRAERGPAGWVLVNLASRPGDVLVVGAGRRGVLGRRAFSQLHRAEREAGVRWQL